MAGEFDIIQRYFTRRCAREDVVLGPGDDAALLAPAAGHELVVTTDTSIAGRHFPEAMPPADIGWRALAVNLSDLAAMGAVPAWFTLALSVPAVDESWLGAFASGLFACAHQFGIELVGGDTTQGNLSVTIQAMGQVPRSRALRRDGARPGDVICVTGTLGDAALALQMLQNGDAMRHGDPAWLLRRLYRPQPRMGEALLLREHAHAAIDLSDGFAADLTHMLRASGVGAVVALDELPLSEPARRCCNAPVAPLQCAGDDYELCVCLGENDLKWLQDRLSCGLTPVGHITEQAGVQWLDAGHPVPPPPGYEHFPAGP